MTCLFLNRRSSQTITGWLGVFVERVDINKTVKDTLVKDRSLDYLSPNTLTVHSITKHLIFLFTGHFKYHASIQSGWTSLRSGPSTVRQFISHYAVFLYFSEWDLPTWSRIVELRIMWFWTKGSHFWTVPWTKTVDPPYSCDYRIYVCRVAPKTVDLPYSCTTEYM